MEITYPIKGQDFAELTIDGELVKYALPPKTGTHGEVFQALSAADETLSVAKGRKIVAYAHGALVHKQAEWANQNRIFFPSRNYLRFPAVLTMVPRNRKFGDLEGGMLIDSDLEGEGIEKQTVVPEDLSGWEVSDGGILVRNGRIFVPYEKWFKEQWDENNGAVIALCGGLEGAEALVRTAKDSSRSYTPIFKVDVNNIQFPEKRVPVLDGSDAGGLLLYCDDHGDGTGGCGVGVLN